MELEEINRKPDKVFVSLPKNINIYAATAKVFIYLDGSWEPSYTFKKNPDTGVIWGYGKQFSSLYSLKLFISNEGLFKFKKKK